MKISADEHLLCVGYVKIPAAEGPPALSLKLQKSSYCQYALQWLFINATIFLQFSMYCFSFSVQRPFCWLSVMNIQLKK